LQIWIFVITPPLTQNDANTGGDAGDTYSTPTALNGTNATYYGYVDKSTDEFDYYSIPVPSYHRINASVSWNTSSATLHLHLYDSTGAYLPGGQGFNNTSPNTVTSGNSSVGGTTVTLMVRAWIGDDDYTLTLEFDNISSSPIYNQNDSGTGDDASDDYNNPTGIITNIGQNDFTGWASNAEDIVDEYSVDVPADYGISVSVSFDTGEANFDVALALMPNPASNIIDTSQTFSSPEAVTSNGTYVGGETVLIEIYANSGEGDYNMTIWIFTLDTDGDGFYDEDEITCGSDPMMPPACRRTPTVTVSAMSWTTTTTETATRTPTTRSRSTTRSGRTPTTTASATTPTRTTTATAGPTPRSTSAAPTHSRSTASPPTPTPTASATPWTTMTTVTATSTPRTRSRSTPRSGWTPTVI
jgi:hypothetical protein